MIRLTREQMLDDIPLSIGTRLGEIELTRPIEVRQLAEAIAAGDAVPQDLWVQGSGFSEEPAPESPKT
ncbi:MAG: hypothetical protein ACOY3Y_01640 [Acidobacteriota bacterium]